MRKLIYYITVSLEGYYKTPDDLVPEQFEPSQQEHQYANDLVRGADALVFGRGMYETMTYWDTVDLNDAETPRVERDFADAFQAKPRHVFSTTLATVDQNATLHRGDAVARVSELKEDGDGSYLMLACGTSLLGELMEGGVVDEVRLLLMPVLLGEGAWLFPPLAVSRALKLNASQTFASGAVLLSYTTT